MARFPIVVAESLASRVSEIVGARVPPRLAAKLTKAMMTAIEKAVVSDGEVAIRGHGKFVARPHPVHPPTGTRCEDRMSICYLPSRAAKNRMSEMVSEKKGRK